MIAVVGVGLEGLGSVSPRGRRLIEQAKVVIGTDRHLELLPASGAERVHWDGGLARLEAIIAGRGGTPTVLLASGDPNLFGIGSTLIDRLGPGAVDIEPSVSSLQLALARARVPMAGTMLVSAHGRPLAAAVALAATASRAAILTDPSNRPDVIAAALAAAGVEHDARLAVCERLGGPGERVREGTVGRPPAGPFDALSVVVVARRGAPGPGLGRPDGDYEHDAGQITKSEVRAISVAALDPGPEDVVWDVGAGSGSVAIEAGRLAVRGAVYAIERRRDRAEQARRNAAASWNVEVLNGEAPQVLAGLPAPDAVFLGGGGSQMAELIVHCARRLREKPSPFAGRIVANVSTLESLSDALSAMRALGIRWRVSQISVARGRELAGRLGWEALNPVHVLSGRVPR